MTQTFFYVLILAVGITCPLFGQTVPQLINYQGRLANPDGSPFPTADYQLSIRIYDGATNGLLVWGPQVFDGVVGTSGHGAMVPVVQGYFNVVLGPADTNGTSLANAFRGSNRFVEVTVNNRPPILPRQQIVSTPYAIQAANGTPPGTVVAFAGHTNKIPIGWLLCDGSSLSTNLFPELFNAVGTNWGQGDGINTFNLPDLRGLFLRGVNGYRTDAYRDPGDLRTGIWRGGAAGNNVGSYQPGELLRHQHRGVQGNPVQQYYSFVPQVNNIYTVSFGPGVTVNNAPSTDFTGGTENRPGNAYVNYIIKY